MTMKVDDPHETLELHQGASKRQVKKAYRRLAKRFHPDRNPDDPEAEEKFKQVQWAYDLLMDERKGDGTLRSTPADNCPRSSFTESGHPFFGFFSAMRAFYFKKENESPPDKT